MQANSQVSNAISPPDIPNTKLLEVGKHKYLDASTSKLNETDNIDNQQTTSVGRYVVKIEGIKDSNKKRISDVCSITRNLVSAEIKVESGKRYGLVVYSTRESAEKIVRKIDGQWFHVNPVSDILKVYLVNEDD